MVYLLSLRIEAGRYKSHGSGTCGIPVESRICLGCGLAIENEKHFLCECPMYTTERNVLKQVCIEYNAKVLSDTLTSKTCINVDNIDRMFVYLMRADDLFVR